jgi:hypothetical protein
MYRFNPNRKSAEIILIILKEIFFFAAFREGATLGPKPARNKLLFCFSLQKNYLKKFDLETCCIEQNSCRAISSDTVECKSFELKAKSPVQYVAVYIFVTLCPKLSSTRQGQHVKLLLDSLSYVPEVVEQY